MPAKTYDVVVIGAGSGGLTAAVGARKIGRSVLLLEREHMGGECTNTGCIPSKSLLHYAKQYHTAKTVSGENAKNEAYRKGAFAYVREKRAEILAEEQPEDFEKLGIDVVMGEAEFVERCSIRAGETTYRFKQAIIASGSQPRPLKVQGLDGRDVLTNETLFELADVPKRTLIIGSGPIGLEMGQALAMLGSQVTIATIDPEVGRLMDPALRPLLQKTNEELGIRTLTSAYITHVEKKSAVFELRTADAKENAEERVPFDKVLVAIGRVPTLPKGLDAAGIAYDERCVMVDRQFRTSNKYVYAIGDVASSQKFTHTADDAARQVVTRIASHGLLRVNARKAVPKVIYTRPEVAQVGLSFEEACHRYEKQELMRLTVPLAENDRARTDAASAGMLVVVARRVSGTVLGAQLIGPRAGELIAIFTLAIDEKLSLWRLRRAIYAYPTYALLIKKAGDRFLAEQLASLKEDLAHLFFKHAPKLAALIFWLSIIYTFQEYRLSNNLSYRDVALQLYDFFTGSMYGPVVYMVLYAIRPLIFFPATLLTALSGALFGFWWGVIYTIVGENASANFAYWIGRFFERGLRLEDTVIGNWVEALRKRPFGTVLFLRLFYFPFDLTNYGSGILRIAWPSYFTATLIGIMPGLLTFVALGASVDLEEFRTMGLSPDVFDPWYVGLSVAIFVGSLGLSRLFKRWQAATE